MLRPFFCYYGGKYRTASHYPSPMYHTIIEPFAGAVGYALRYHGRKIILFDTDPIIAGLWSYLIKVSRSEIRSLPPRVSHVDELTVPQEARWLIGFWLNKGSNSPRKSPSKWARSGTRPNSYWGTVIRDRIAIQVDRIRHWRVYNKSYDTSPDISATWFIDPPYERSGRIYRHTFADHSTLAEWCRSREGQVIVCEQEGATWLPFRPFRTIATTPGARGKSRSREVIWTA